MSDTRITEALNKALNPEAVEDVYKCRSLITLLESGYAAIAISGGNIVDRRHHENCIPLAENKFLGIAAPVAYVIGVDMAKEGGDKMVVTMTGSGGTAAVGDKCNHALRAKGLVYPRTCQECGFGPCKYAK